MKKYSFEFVKNFVARRGGTLLSKEYVDCKSKLHIRCKKGHEWHVTFDGLKNRNTWCPTCAGVTRRTIELVHFAASLHGGKCLSTEYTSYHSKYKFECSNGHVFYMQLSNILANGSWCKKCCIGIGEDIVRCVFEHFFLIV